jgi:hypothetical protein
MNLAKTLKEEEQVAGQYFEKHSLLLVNDLKNEQKYTVYKKGEAGYMMVGKINIPSMSTEEIFDYLEMLNQKPISEFKEGLIVPYSDFKYYKETFDKKFQLR